MNKFLKIALFSLFIIGVYTVYSTVIIPPITPEAPPKEEASGTVKTVEELIALGEQVYNGKGACALCHSPVAGRAPLLDKAAVAAETRLKEKGYAGKAKSAEEYLYELVAPSAFVVPGFGASGTNDTVSPMPGVKDPAFALSETEIKAVIAYLQRLAGVEVTVKLDVEKPAGEASGTKPTLSSSRRIIPLTAGTTPPGRSATSFIPAPATGPTPPIGEREWCPVLTITLI